MELKYLHCCLLMLIAYAKASTWNNLNCPAPRAPDNGLSFIFRNGELVHFRCHPGYVMRGKPVAYCVNNVWTEPAPECVPVKKWPHDYDKERDPSYYQHSQAPSRHTTDHTPRRHKERELFQWGNRTTRSPHRIYGDGPRRLPLINGIWPSQDQVSQVMSLGPLSTPGPKNMIKEEIDIAELRQQQLEELKRQRFLGKRRNHRKSKEHNSVLVDESAPRETVISLGDTEEGQALSIAFAKLSNDTVKTHTRHRYRHRDGRGRSQKRRSRKKKHRRPVHPTYSSFIIARASRVDTSGISPYQVRYQFGKGGTTTRNDNEVAELRRRPVSQVRHQQSTDTHATNYGEFDTSCVESLYGREVPMIAPQVPHAYVYRYETKKNKKYPYNSYMQVKYRCLSRYTFANAKAQTLNCKEASWVGEIPRCVGNRI